MSDEQTEFLPPPAPLPLGPGADDPRSPAAVVAGAAVRPLGPGEDDPRSPARGVALPATVPHGPGETVGDEPDDALVMLAPAPAGPGGTDSGPRHIAVVRRPTPTVVSDAMTPLISDVPAADPPASIDNKE